jgi:hypothetical protein
MQLAKLEQLAIDGDLYSRQALAFGLTRVYLEGTHTPSETERDLFYSVMMKVIDELADHVIAQISKDLSTTDRISGDMAFHFASHESIEIARPMLEDSPCLSTEQMTQIITSRSQEHQLAITRRRTVEQEVAKVLAEHGSMQVLTTLTSKDKVHFNQQIVETLLERGAADEAVQAAIKARASKNAFFGETVKSALSTGLRFRLGEFAETLDETGISRLTATAEDQIKQRFREERASRLKAKFIRHKIRSNETTLEREMKILADQGKLRNVMSLLACWHCLAPEEVEHAFKQQSHEPVVLLVRAAGLTMPLFETIEAMRCLFFGHDVTSIEAKKQSFQSVSAAQALKTIELLKERLEQKKARLH